MRKKTLILLLISVSLLQINALLAFSEATSRAQGTYQEEQQYNVGFIGVPDPDIITDVGGTIIYEFYPEYDFIPAMVASLTSEQADELRGKPEIDYVEYDDEYETCAETLPWGVDRIDAEKVHPSNKGKGVEVAVLDTGIDYTHPDLAANYKGGIDFANMDLNPMDDNGHGTHVAGTIAAVSGNGIGVIGVAPRAWLYAVKVLKASGSGRWSWITRGIAWSIVNRMKIISMSLGGPTPSFLVHFACDIAYNRGLLLVAAAGNSGPGMNTVRYPAKYASVIAVSAIDQSDNIASFSSRGSEVEVSAPGVNIYSTTLGGGYGTKSGTSMACPHVSGTAALVWFRNPTFTNKLVRICLQTTAEDLGTSGKDSLYGYGLVDAEKASRKYYVGGFTAPVDKFGLLAPYIGLASTVVVATAATTIYVKRVKRRTEK